MKKRAARPSHVSATEVRIGDFVKLAGEIVEVYGRLFVAGSNIPLSSLEAGWFDPHYIFETSAGFARISTEGELELV